MNSKTDLWIDSRREEIISALQKLITFKSVSCRSDVPGEPFGPECKKALTHTLSLCEQMGFKPVDMDGYIGYADYGKGEETLGILTHLDVVPEGEGWTKGAPYEGRVTDGWMVGRGTLDDKTPYEVFEFLYGEGTAAKLHIAKIDQKEVVLKPRLVGIEMK